MIRQRRLSDSSVQALIRLLAQKGLTDDQIDRGIQFAETGGASTMRHGFELAMSAALYSDAQLEAGMRFDCGSEA